jgi:hypothetical protein
MAEKACHNLTPSEGAEEALQPLLDQVISWSKALQTVRS